MTAGETILVLGLIGVFVALYAHSRGVSSWWLFGGGCVPGVVVVLLAVQVLSTPCDQPDTGGVSGGFFVICLGLSLTLYAAAAFAGVLDGVRFAKAGLGGWAFSRFVACPLASAVGVGVDLYLALGAFFHCFEL